MIELLDFVQTRGLPPAALRARIALDVVEQESNAAVPCTGEPRVTIASVQVDERGRAHAPACASHGQLATLLWEILAGRVADSDELPWSDPADDLPPGVVDTFASLTLRPAKDIPELCRRFAAGIRSHAASHDQVVQVFSGPERITLRAPPVQIEALRTLSAGEAPQAAAALEIGIVTRVCPVVSLPVISDAPTEEQPRSTLDPWHAPSRSVELSETSAAISFEPEGPRRRKTWPVVAACLAAALVLIGLASRQRTASTTATAARSPATESTAAVSPATASPTSASPAGAASPPAPSTLQPSATPVVGPATSARALLSPSTKPLPRLQVAPPARSAPPELTAQPAATLPEPTAQPAAPLPELNDAPVVAPPAVDAPAVPAASE